MRIDWDNSPWMTGGLTFKRGALLEVEKDAVRGYHAEEEACGYLTGPRDEPLVCDTACRVQNLAKVLHARDPATYFHTARTFFAFQARTLDQAIMEGYRTGSLVKVLYHSHLDVGAHMSGTDAAVLSGGLPPASAGGPARMGAGPEWPLAFLISSVQKADAEPFVNEHRLYVWRAGAFVESSFVVEP